MKKSKNGRPIIPVTKSPLDYVLEVFGWSVLIGVWSLTFFSFTDLPETIPVHYNAAGEADRYGSKETLFVLPAVATLLFVGLTILNRYPYIFNYPVTITSENAARQYSLATRLIRAVNLVVVIIFGLIVLKTIQHSNGSTSGLGSWFLPVVIGLTFLPIMYYMVESTKKAK